MVVPPENSLLRVHQGKGTVRWLQPSEFPLWDRFVACHPKGFLTHTSRWCQCIEQSFAHIQGKILASFSASGELVGGLPTYSVRSWLLGDRLVSAPFATLFDPLVSPVAPLADFISVLQNFASSERIGSIEIRTFSEVPSSILPFGWSVTSDFKQHCLDIRRGPELVYAALSRTAVRRMIAKAERAGFRVEFCPDSFPVFRELLSHSRRELGLPLIPRRFFESLQRSFRAEERPLFIAKIGGRPVAAALALRSNGVFLLEYAGLAAGQKASGVNQLLYWQTIKWACEKGDGLFHFGRTHARNAGLRAYKAHWGTEEADLATIVFPAPSPISLSSEAFKYRLVRAISQKAPQSLFQIFSAFCYRHLG